MTTKILNPDSTIMQQSEGHWQKYLMLVISKLAPAGVTITVRDMEKLAGEERILLTHGHIDSIEFKLVTRAEAERLIAYDKTQRGTA